MKRIPLVLVAVAALCFGASGVRPVAAKAPSHTGDDFAGKVLAFNMRSEGSSSPAVIQHATVRRLGHREYLAGEYVPPTKEVASLRGEWLGSTLMVPLDAIEFIVVFDDKEKAIRMIEAQVAEQKAAAQGAFATPPATDIVPPPAKAPCGIK